MKTETFAMLAAILSVGAAWAQNTSEAPNPPKKADDSDHVQITSNSAGKQHCRDTDLKSADGALTAQTTMNGRLRKAEADCKKTAPKPVKPESKSLEDPANKSSVPSNDHG